MTGTTRFITRAARHKIPKGQPVGSYAFCGAGPGTTIPGAFACRTATALLQP